LPSVESDCAEAKTCADAEPAGVAARVMNLGLLRADVTERHHILRKQVCGGVAAIAIGRIDTEFGYDPKSGNEMGDADPSSLDQVGQLDERLR
jgi:hypothetical protein